MLKKQFAGIFMNKVIANILKKSKILFIALENFLTTWYFTDENFGLLDFLSHQLKTFFAKQKLPIIKKAQNQQNQTHRTIHMKIQLQNPQHHHIYTVYKIVTICP